ncbi:hypothetical protein [Ammoniphilus sp. CFH 90114]|uniref:hypothetical protein n=1 Tax=Ammoniphilus sp. CFH 90114 TaxID=2493665 RepID=UPI00100E9E73|nr:hypothetical protein [Ammoniphilus sp. CFH 90114]RXT13668.1 hypothetical protein EIZ39_05825 [Ammoniphilus sp. CFH 90114]
MLYTIVIILGCLLALIGTLQVAKNPKDKNYGTVNRRVRNLSIIYGIVTLIMLFGFILYIYL